MPHNLAAGWSATWMKDSTMTMTKPPSSHSIWWFQLVMGVPQSWSLRKKRLPWACQGGDLQPWPNGHHAVLGQLLGLSNRCNWLQSYAKFQLVDTIWYMFIHGNFHSHGGTPLSLDGLTAWKKSLHRIAGWWLGVCLWLRKPPHVYTTLQHVATPDSQLRRIGLWKWTGSSRAANDHPGNTLRHFSFGDYGEIYQNVVYGCLWQLFQLCL